MISGLTMRDFRDLWRAVAKAHDANGEPEAARQARETAKLWNAAVKQAGETRRRREDF